MFVYATGAVFLMRIIRPALRPRLVDYPSEGLNSRRTFSRRFIWSESRSSARLKETLK